MILNEVLEKLMLTQDELCEIEDIENKYEEKIEDIAKDYFEKRKSFPHYLETVRKTLAEKSPHTADLLLVLHLSSFLKNEYKRKNIPESMFWGFVCDVRCKKDECRRVKKVLGTFVADWYEGFFKLFRFSFGRLECDIIKCDQDIESKNGKVKKGDYVLSCHIPSDGKLNYYDCIDSYKKAYAFFKDYFEDTLPIICISWLLYPEYAKVFEVCPNIEKFISDFEIYREETEDKFLDVWRVFSCDNYEDTKALPNDTKLQRKYIEYIENSGTFGEGFGILFFDGEKVLR